MMSDDKPSRLIYQGRIIRLELQTVAYEEGQPVEFEMVRHPGGVVVAAINDQRQFCLIRQYRHVIDQWIWELPAGKIDRIDDLPEPILPAAKRELEEETGTRAKQWDSLGYILSSPGVFDERLDLFLAQDLTLHQSSPEPHEHIEIHWIDLDQAMQMCFDGQINDAKTIIGLQRAQHFLNLTG